MDEYNHPLTTVKTSTVLRIYPASFQIVDIDENGNLSIETDTELIEAYGEKNNDDDDETPVSVPYIKPSTTRIDQKPMG